MDKQNTDKQSESSGSMNGAPTALLYLGMFAAVGCIGVFLFVCFTGGFFWAWMRLCDWPVVSAALPTGGRFGLGLLIYLLLVGAAFAKLRKSEGRTEREAARLRQKETASMQQKETARAHDNAIAPTPQNEAVPAAQGNAPSPLQADRREAAGVPPGIIQATANAAPQTLLRFDGVYVGEEPDGEMNDYVTGALVDCQNRHFLRFYPNGRVGSMSRKAPVTAPENTVLTPEEAFVKLGQLGPASGSAYTFTDDKLSFQVGSEDYQILNDGLSLRLRYFTTPDPYGSNMSDEIVVHFDFVKAA